MTTCAQDVSTTMHVWQVTDSKVGNAQSKFDLMSRSAADPTPLAVRQNLSEKFLLELVV